MYVVNRTRGTFLGVDIAIARSSLRRMIGLYTRRSLQLGDGVWLVPCNSIQTIGMRMPIDVVFLDSRRHVVRVLQHVKPGRVIWRVEKANSVLELPSGAVRSSATRVGDVLELVEALEGIPALPLHEDPQRIGG